MYQYHFAVCFEALHKIEVAVELGEPAAPAALGRSKVKVCDWSSMGLVGCNSGCRVLGLPEVDHWVQQGKAVLCCWEPHCEESSTCTCVIKLPRM